MDAQQKLRVLMVGGNRASAAACSAALAAAGADVGVCRTGGEALQSAALQMPQIVFVDLGLSDMAGHELAWRMRHALGGRHVTLVATTTSLACEGDILSAAEAGFEHCLRAPLDVDHMRMWLKTAADARPSPRPGAVVLPGARRGPGSDQSHPGASHRAAPAALWPSQPL